MRLNANEPTMRLGKKETKQNSDSNVNARLKL